MWANPCFSGPAVNSFLAMLLIENIHVDIQTDVHYGPVCTTSDVSVNICTILTKKC